MGKVRQDTERDEAEDEAQEEEQIELSDRRVELQVELELCECGEWKRNPCLPTGMRKKVPR